MGGYITTAAWGVPNASKLATKAKLVIEGPPEEQGRLFGKGLGEVEKDHNVAIAYHTTYTPQRRVPPPLSSASTMVLWVCGSKWWGGGGQRFRAGDKIRSGPQVGRVPP